MGDCGCVILCVTDCQSVCVCVCVCHLILLLHSVIVSVSMRFVFLGFKQNNSVLEQWTAPNVLSNQEETSLLPTSIDPSRCSFIAGDWAQPTVCVCVCVCCVCCVCVILTLAWFHAPLAVCMRDASCCCSCAGVLSTAHVRCGADGRDGVCDCEPCAPGQAD